MVGKAMGASVSRLCCLCSPGIKEDGKFETPIKFTISPASPKHDSSMDAEDEDLDFVRGDDGGSLSSEGLKDDILFGGMRCEDDSSHKSLEEISLSKEMEHRSKEILESYQSSSYLRATSSSEDSCLPESIPSTQPLHKEEGTTPSVVSSESFGGRRNRGFLGDDEEIGFPISSYHYKTEVIGEVKSVVSSESSEITAVSPVTTTVNLIDRCMGLELNGDDGGLTELSSIHFVLGDDESSSLNSSVASLEAMFPLSLTKTSLDISEEVQTRL